MAALLGSSFAAVTGCGDDDKDSSIGGDGSGRADSGGAGGNEAGGGGTGASTAGGGVDSGGTAGTAGGGVDSGGTGGSAATGGNAGSGGTIAACAGLPIDTIGGCIGSLSEAVPIRVDMFIMMDRSVSMLRPLSGTTESRWDGVRQAITSFVDNERSAGVGVGIGFFPYALSAEYDVPANCSAANYAMPVVPIGFLPGNAMALSDAINATDPTGYTPTRPALEGASIYTKNWANDHPGYPTVVVLVTDGLPTDCGSTVSNTADVAAAAYATDPRIRTYVIGLAPGLNLNEIASDGGTSEAFLVEQGDVTEPLIEQMLNITSDDVPCDFHIPAPQQGQQLDPAKVRIVYTPAAGSAEEIPKVNSLGACATSTAGGWYFNDAIAPTSIHLCPCTCTQLGTENVSVELGCEPRPPPAL